jgi:hypothetical protein
VFKLGNEEAFVMSMFKKSTAFPVPQIGRLKRVRAVKRALFDSKKRGVNGWPYEGLSLVDRNRFGSRRTYFSGGLRRGFWLEYRIHGLTDEFTSDAKRFLSLRFLQLTAGPWVIRGMRSTGQS